MAGKKKRRVVIIGNSAAGLSALEAFRKEDKDSRVVLIDREPFPAYSRVITPYFIMGSIKKEEGLFLRGKEYYKEWDVEALFGREVLSIDMRSRTVELNKGKAEPFDALLIASGASPIRPQIEGVLYEDVLVLRSLSDARRLRELKKNAQKGVFFGGGLVTLQTLQALFESRSRFTLIVKSDQILSQTLDRDGAQIVQRHLEKMGVRIIKGRDIVGWKREDGSKKVFLDNGEEIETDFLFVGKGVTPNDSFLDGSGVKTERGILVDQYLRTNLEDIFAAGDVARSHDFFSDKKVNYGLWPSAVEQGEIVGKNMAGAKAVYPGNFKMNVTRIFSFPIVSMGDVGTKRVKETLTKKDEQRNIYRKICLDEKGVIVGAILVNQVEDLGVLQGLIRGRKDGEFLKLKSIWKSSIRYGLIQKNIVAGR